MTLGAVLARLRRRARRDRAKNGGGTAARIFRLCAVTDRSLARPARHHQPPGQNHRREEASVQATGVLREQLIGTDFSDYSQSRKRPAPDTKKHSPKGSCATIPSPFAHSTGRIMDVLYNAAVYKDDKGNVLGVFAAARDVTVQKQASQYARSLIEPRWTRSSRSARLAKSPT